jgi:hypothetical protein
MSEAESEFHRQGENGEDNTKWIDETGHHEAVYDGEGNLVTDRLNGGTYNFVAPKNWVGHALADVLPYFLWGNGPIVVTYPSPSGRPPEPIVIVGPIEQVPEPQKPEPPKPEPGQTPGMSVYR